MTSTEIARTDPLHDRITYAKALAEASLLPESYRKQPANVLVAIETADALGISPMQALQGITVIKGKMTMSSELMRALVLRAGHQLRVDVLTENECRMVAARKEWPDDVQAFTFTMQDAQRAGLTGSQTYKQHPKAMLLARCTSLACRAVFPDVIAGVSYAPEELEHEPAPVRRVATERLMPVPESVIVERVATDIPGVEVDADGVLWDSEDAPEAS